MKEIHSLANLKHWRIPLLTLMVAVLSSSCGTYYFPQTGHLPLIKQKGELVAEVGIVPAISTLVSTGEEIFRGHRPNTFMYQATCAYSFSDHWAAQIASRNVVNPSHQAMVGWFNPLGENATVEIYGGYGYSLSDSWSAVHDYHAWGNAQTVFLQGDIGIPSYTPSWWKSISFSTAFGLRVGGVRMNYQEEQSYAEYDPVTDHFNSVFVRTPGIVHKSFLELQPIIQLGIGGKRLKLEVGMGLSFMTYHTHPDTSPISGNISLSYRIPLLRNQ